jgi:hypothetical protein
MRDLQVIWLVIVPVKVLRNGIPFLPRIKLVYSID